MAFARADAGAGVGSSADVAEATSPKLLTELWESIVDMGVMKKVETSFYRHFQDCASTHPFRGPDDWQSVVLSFTDCRTLMKEAFKDLRRARKDKDEVVKYSLKKMLDLHIFYGWQLSIEVMLRRGQVELDHVVASVVDVLQSTSMRENPSLPMILEGLRAITEAEHYFKSALIWSQVCKGYMVETLHQHWEREIGDAGSAQSEMTWALFVETKALMTPPTAWRYRRL